jgi:hypothetical protein
MTTIYKQGDRGDGVRQLQRMLVKAGYRLAVDGYYGSKTANAVWLFQLKTGIKPVDGIAGPATLARLASATQAQSAADNQSGLSVASDELPIVYSPIQTHITFSISRPIHYIVIHYTAGVNSRRGAAMQNRDVFLRNSASADFVVDDEQIVQVNPDLRNYYCWAVGDRLNPYSGGGRLYRKATNKNTINIEVCSTLQRNTTAQSPNHTGWSFTDHALSLTLRLVRKLMQQYGIRKENIVRHYDVSGKPCPGIPGWNDAPLFTTDGKQTTEKNNSLEWEAWKEKI